MSFSDGGYPDDGPSPTAPRRRSKKIVHESNDVRYGEVAAAKASYTRSLGEIPQVHEPFGGDTGTPQHPSPAKPYRARSHHLTTSATSRNPAQTHSFTATRAPMAKARRIEARVVMICSHASKSGFDMRQRIAD